MAHLDTVTSLAVDQHGLYLISGSHDCSIRYASDFVVFKWKVHLHKISNV